MKHPAEQHAGAVTDPHETASSDLQQRLSAILDEYLTLLEAGSKIDDERFLAAHADVAHQLRPHLTNLRAMQLAIDSAGSAPPQTMTYSAPKQLGVYTLLREIGRGGQGIVYEATDPTLNRRVALKVLPFAALLDRKQIDRFNNEAQAAARLHHPNIVPVYAVGVDRGVHFYAMQYIEGAPLNHAIEQLASRQSPMAAGVTTLRPRSTDELTPLSSWLVDAPAAKDDYRLDENHCRQVARLGIAVCQALSHAHEVGIVHRDIKPSNLLLDENGKPWLADFGLARIPNDKSMTATGDVLGTVRYMSPEQARGRNAFVDHRTDIYSLGITLYELLTLRPAFVVQDREEFMRQIGTQEPRPPRRLNPAIPNDLENIILRAIELEPIDRYESSEQMAADLQRFLDGKPTLARRAPVSDRVFKWVRKHRRMAVATAAALLIAAVGLGVANLMISRQAERTVAALREARDILDELGVSMSDRLATIPGAEGVRHDLLIRTKGYYDSLLDQSSDPVLRLDRGITLAKSGSIAEQLGDLRRAQQFYVQAHDELRNMVRRFPHEVRYRSELANCLNNQAMLLVRLGQFAAATEKLDAAVASHKELLYKDSTDTQAANDLACTQANLAFVYEKTRQYDASRAAYEAAINMYRDGPQDKTLNGRQQRQLAISLHNLASLVATRDIDYAVDLNQEAIAIQEALCRNDDSIALQSELAISYDRRAELCMINGQMAAADRAYGTATELLKRLAEAAPKNMGVREDLAITLNHWGEMYRETQAFDKAEQVFAEAAQLLYSMVELAPNQPAFRSSLGAVLFNQGLVLMELKDKDAAYDRWTEGLAHQQAAVTSDPAVRRYQTFLDLQQTSLQEEFPETTRQN